MTLTHSVRMERIDELIAAAEEVHDGIGSGQTEATYHRAMERELSERGIPFTSEGTIPIFYKDTPVGKRRPDMFVKDDRKIVVVELKAGTTKGKEQLFDYESIVSDDDNFYISGAILIQFNEEVETVTS